MFGETQRDNGMMLVAAPAFAYHGNKRDCSEFARVIVALLLEAVPPQLEHLWVLADDEPRRRDECWKACKGQHAKAHEEHRDRNKDDHHPRPEFQAELGSRTIQCPIDW